MATIYLGSCDTGKIPKNKLEFLKPYHWVGGVFNGQISFRDDDRTTWRRFREDAPNGDVKALQTFLFNAGFMPRASKDGVFGYVTQASVRLFQEYVRTVEGVHSMKPDGIVGSGTWNQIKLWQQENKMSEWGKSTATNGSDEYKKWMTLLNKTKSHYQQSPNRILNAVNDFSGKTQTLKVNDWKFDPNDIHLIGIRHGQFDYTKNTGNKDIFLLLIKGMVFKFWGSTVPNQDQASRPDMPFLVEGQHQYRFGWHMVSNEKKVYRALRPSPHGVLVLRSDEEGNISEDLQAESAKLSTNGTINIHWSGLGLSSWSAGCMVIAGQSYIDNKDKVIDCSKFAARNYGELSSSVRKTKAAYNLFADLILAYAPQGVDHMYFTLGRDTSLDRDSSLGKDYRENVLKQIKNA